MVWKAGADAQGEACKIRWELVPYTRGFGLDLGCGAEKCYPHFIGIDNRSDADVPCDPDLTFPDASELPMFASLGVDFVFSSHLLHLVPGYKKALAEWWRLVKVGGYMTLYLPHKLLTPDQTGFMEKDIVDAMKENPGWDLLRNERRAQDDEYSFLQVYRKRADDGCKQLWSQPKPKKTCAVVRYGAYGDLMQMSSVLPGLKEQGYHITVYTTPRGYEVSQNEPLIDEFVIQDKDQIPNKALGFFWAHLRKKYDKFINLSESTEATLLAIPDRVSYHWPHETRAKKLNGNYLEFSHDLAGVPYSKPLMRFVATELEILEAITLRDRLGGSPTILWVLSGSSIHKTWPYVDIVVARLLLTLPNVRIVTTGDGACKILEAPWKNEARIITKSGDWSIRETMAFAQKCDLVIGPETGVMNAVAMEPMPKIVFLSHSSNENLTRDWENTYAMHPVNTPCYPCHMLHYNWDYCHKGPKTGTALCQEDISADVVWHACVSALRLEHRLERAA